MSVLNKRLASLETAQTPQQIIVRQLQRMGHCETLDEWLRDVYRPQHLLSCRQNGERLTQKCRKQIRDKGEQRQAIRKASQELVYLHTLSIWPGQQLELERYRYLFTFSSLVILQMSLMIPPSPCKETVLKSFVSVWSRLFIDLSAARQAERLLSERYFAGQALFVREHAHFLRDRLEKLQHIRQLLEEAIAADEELAKLAIFTEAPLEEQAQRLAQEHVRRAQQNARLAVYDSEDRTDDMAAIYQELFKVGEA